MVALRAVLIVTLVLRLREVREVLLMNVLGVVLRIAVLKMVIVVL